METFEEMFKALGCDKPFRKKVLVDDFGCVEGLTISGCKTYGKLTDILDFLQGQGLIKYDIDILDNAIEFIAKQDVDGYLKKKLKK